MKFIGLYLDHLMSDPYSMAVMSASLKDTAQALAGEDVLLFSTCLRVELYGPERPVRRLAPELLGQRFAAAETSQAAMVRLAELAAGLHSQIVGESYVADQLGEALEVLDPASATRRFAAAALAVGRSAKQRHGLAAVANYDRIVADLVDASLGPDGRGDTLYIAGGGMLGRSIVQGPLPGRFGSTVMITRDPKKLRKKLRAVPLSNVAFRRPDDLDCREQPRSVLLVATNDMSGSYSRSLLAAIRATRPLLVIELSSLPELAAPLAGLSSYVNMYTPRFLSFVDRNNQQVTTRTEAVRADIRRHCAMLVPGTAAAVA